MHDNLTTDSGNELDTSHFENHKQLTVPEFYVGSVLSGDTTNMPEDAPFRYQGAYPFRTKTSYENTDGYTSFSIDKDKSIRPGSTSGIQRLSTLLRTYALSFARRHLLKKRIKWLQEQLNESLDWVDTQGDEYGYDGANTAVSDDNEFNNGDS